MKLKFKSLVHYIKGIHEGKIQSLIHYIKAIQNCYHAQFPNQAKTQGFKHKII